ncbi:hypothetical protein A1O3_08765 [Capronia epimyces CBS 606.96]|uniref:RING-type domain-containing protein n=1 Tax=Capronia epimyces CBS 606.96 TaxID=1182542 RepID=W9YA55_9EURO|nr:uncharacterized protein A1O3_08765 [Capronia epimyces CBS 606.96]EXJ79264.1 hypothetical protein A1O3_08765 [Capronia epimyces CBS 606.96]
MATADISLLSTFQKHIEDMRSLSLCKICIKPFYEPFILPCGHTYCYSCLASWFGGSQSRKRKKNCPDCRAEVKVQPSPNYLLRDLVHMFISRAELLPEDETVQEHQQAKEDEAVMLAADRTGGGLFKGAFVQPRHHHHIVSWGQGIMDHEDGVIRCPECHWELEDGQCLQCGFLQYEPGDSDSDFDEDSLGPQSLDTIDTDFDADGDEIDHEFGSSMDLRHFPYDDYETPSEGTAPSEMSPSDRTGNLPYSNEFRYLYDVTDSDDDTNSESTMTVYSRQRRSGAPTGTVGPLHRSNSERSVPNDDSDSHVTTRGDTSDALTNYDEPTEASEDDNSDFSARPRSRRFIVSDDSEEDSAESSGNEGASEELSGAVDRPENERNEEDAESSGIPPDGVVDGVSESEESDIRPPQPSALRRQHLQGHRARRSTHNYQTIQTHGARGNNTQEMQGRQRSNGRSRSNMQHHGNPNRRDSQYLHPQSRSGYGRLLRGVVIP